jgi:hypothetical protein
MIVVGVEGQAEGLPLAAGSCQHFCCTPWQSCARICLAVPSVSTSALLA